MKVKIQDDNLVLIRISRELRATLRELKRGNPNRPKGVDTYDDVIRRVLK